MGGLSFLALLGSPIASDTGIGSWTVLTPVITGQVPWAAMLVARRLDPALRPGVFANRIEQRA